MLPYPLDALKQAAGCVALDHVAEMEQRVATLVEERGRVHAALADPAASTMTGIADVVEHLGSDTNIYAQVEGIGPLMVRQHGHVALRPGDPVDIAIQPGKAHLFDTAGKALRQA